MRLLLAPLLWIGCFLLGGLAERAVTPPRVEGAAPAGQEPATEEEAPVARRPGVEPALQQRLLEQIRAGEWGPENEQTLVRQLLADPDFISRLGSETPAGEQAENLSRTFAVLRSHCPAALWKVAAAMDFPLPDRVEIHAALRESVAANPARALDYADSRVERIDAALRRSLLGEIAATPEGARLLVRQALAGRDRHEEVAAALTLLHSLEEEPPAGWENLRQAAAQKHLLTEKREARAWLEAGCPLDIAIRWTDEELAGRLQSLLCHDEAVSPDTLRQLVMQGRGTAVSEGLAGLIVRGRMSRALEVLESIQVPSGPQRDQLLNHALTELPAWEGDRTRLLTEIESFSDAGLRDRWLTELMRDWAERDPDGAAALVEHIQSPPLREGVLRTIEGASLKP